MENVALFLQQKAQSCDPGSLDFDLFGRSSFNRYYYATFLKVRSMLGSMNPNWFSLNHAGIPDLLTGEILKTIKTIRKRGLRFNDSETVLICNQAEASAHELARIMKKANYVRVAADYNPDIKVTPDSHGRFQLSFVTVTEAHEWPERTQHYGFRIKRAWDLLDD